MSPRDRARTRGLAVVLAALAAFQAAPAALAAAATPLLPGELMGGLKAYTVKRRDSISLIALKHTVNPVRITRPSAPSLRDGLQAGEVITVDTRHIRPRFTSDTSGIVLNVPEAQVYLVNGGQLVKEYPVAVSRPETPVPIGRTRVVSKDANPTWYVPKSIQEEMARAGRRVITQVPPGPSNPLGPRWIGFWDGSFGFHGTNAPWSIKTYASHGCVRFLAHDIKDLYARVAVGTPVHVVYQPVKLAANSQGVWLSVYPDLYKRGFDYTGAVKGLAARIGVSDHLDWAKVTGAIRARDGIIRNVSPYGANPVPTLMAAPKPRPRPRPTPTPEPTFEGPTSDEILAPVPAEAEPGYRKLYQGAPSTPMPLPDDALEPESLIETPPGPWYSEE